MADTSTILSWVPKCICKYVACLFVAYYFVGP